MLLAIAGAEVGLRRLGITPFDPDAVRAMVGTIAVEPGGRLVEPDPTLGFVNVRGKVDVTFGDLEFSATHDEQRHRITNSNPANDAGREEIYIFGCSIAHGFGVDDEETFPYLLQQAAPSWKVTNFGIESASTVQALLELEQLLAAGAKPKCVVLAYAGFHDERNVSLRKRRRELAPLNPVIGDVLVPYARLTESDDLEIYEASLQYREFPLSRWSAILNLIDLVLIGQEMQASRMDEVTRALLLRFQKLCREHDIELVVAGIWPDAKEILAWCAEQGIANVDLSFDTSTREYLTDSKVDRHPGRKGHQHYATRLAEFLRTLLDKQSKTEQPDQAPGPPAPTGTTSVRKDPHE
jgi:hypothetical protein